MNVAISTIHISSNYGAALQAYALRQYVEDMGHDAHIIDYINPLMEKGLDPVRTGTSAYDVYTMAHDCLKFAFRRKKRLAFTGFFQRRYRLTPRLTAAQLTAGMLNKKYDLYLCGSDQIWNPQVTGGCPDPVYFGAMAPAGAAVASYAASFGGYEYPDVRERKLVDAWLQRMGSVSVREESGKKTLLRQFGIHGTVSADPVLLLEKREWAERFELDAPAMEPYILVYALKNLRAAVRTAREMGHRHRLAVRVVGETLFPFSGLYAEDAGPEEFLRLIYNSRFVITNSFHGTAFALNFQKPLAALDTGMASRASRITGLLDVAGLSSRYMRPEEALALKELDMDYGDATVRLDAYRQESRQYLRDLLESQARGKE